MNEIMWLSLALGRVSIRLEMLEQENMGLKNELAALKNGKPRLVKGEKKVDDGISS